jgi:hypothetical protein
MRVDSTHAHPPNAREHGSHRNSSRTAPVAESAPGSADRDRPFVGIHLRCCNVYVRAYANAERTAFVGWCPRCATPVRVEVVNDGGSRSRFFRAD